MKRRTWRQFGTAFALACLAIRLLIAAVHVPPAVAADPSDPASLFSQIVLCTPAGLRIITLDKDGKPLDSDNGSGTAQSCPICTSLGGAPLALAPSADALPVPLFTAATLADVERASLVSQRRPATTRGRDPPLPV